MQGREIMTDWVLEALKAFGGRGPILEICKYVWIHHDEDLRRAGDLMYEWQYEIRWAGDILRREGTIRPASESPRGIWELA